MGARLTGRRSTLILAVLFLLCCSRLFADGARFDLSGPPIDVRVTRNGVALPIDSVPNLQPGDKIWLHPDLPETQSVRYLLVVAFLRGTTNPPPDDWFIRIETWDKKVRTEGTTVTVPAEAQQVLLFLAPATGGDFSTLRSAVQGRPGVFVRASQDLNAASFEQGRIEKYISSIKQAPPDPKALQEHSDLLAKTLSLKPNADCFKRPADQQETCLMQVGSQTLLDDGHGETVASMLSSGPNSDLINQAGTTQLAGGGLYSAYIGTVIDLVRIMTGLHTAKYQYIPAITFPQQQSLNLRLNMPPSFHDPKSVIVIGLPAIQETTPPPLRATDPKQVACLVKPHVALSVEGAPLVFSTNFAHDMVLHINAPMPVPDIPLVADAYQGGLIFAPAPQRHELAKDDSAKLEGQKADPAASSAQNSAASGDAQLTGTILGQWGFDHFTGPTLPVQNVPGKGWRLAGDEPVAGHDEHLQLASDGTACIRSITAETAPDKTIKADWKRNDDSGKVEVSLRAADPSSLRLQIQQYGGASAESVALQALPEPATLTAVVFHAGDSSALLRGARLDEVKQVDLGGVVFTPQPVSPDENELALTPAATTSRLHTGEKLTARVTLKDGRILHPAVTVAPPRPSIALLNRNIQQPTDSAIQLAGKDDLSLNQPLAFSLKSAQPFSRQEQIEIASSDNSLHTTLSIAAGTLILQDPHTILASFDALKTFGPSAFGPLHLRAVAPDGSTSDWLPLVTLVRLPALTSLQCPSDAAAPCTLSGSELYLLDTVSAAADLSNPATVPEGFIGDSLPVPHPADDKTLYLRLRDDPAAVDTFTFPINTATSATQE